MSRKTVTRITVGSVQELMKELIDIKQAALGVLSLRFKNSNSKDQQIISHTMDYIKNELKEYKDYEIVIEPKELLFIHTQEEEETK